MYTTHREPHNFSMEEDQECNTSLGLRIGGGSITSRRPNHDRKPPVRFDVLFPPRMKEEEEEEEEGKPTKERYAYRSIPKKIDGVVVAAKEKAGGGAGKKLRLTEEQSALLEGSFREHHTLNLARKQELAGRLGLKPRQVEVWFQNRRARTKLKQMEANCELLKKCCESLSDENRRLKRELQELRLARALPPSGSRLPEVAAILSMCSSCEQAVAGDGGSRITDDSSMAC